MSGYLAHMMTNLPPTTRLSQSACLSMVGVTVYFSIENKFRNDRNKMEAKIVRFHTESQRKIISRKTKKNTEKLALSHRSCKTLRQVTVITISSCFISFSILFVPQGSTPSRARTGACPRTGRGFYSFALRESVLNRI